MQAIVYVAHGTKDVRGIAEVKTFVAAHQKQFYPYMQTLSFLDFVKPSPLEAIHLSVMQGATHIALVPILLLAAGHARRDIPELIVTAKKMYPHVTFSCAPVFGVNDQVVDSVIDRIDERGEVNENSRILLVVRGSSDPRILSDITALKQSVRARFLAVDVDASFLFGQRPLFSDRLHNLYMYCTDNVYVVPLLLFTGRLMQQIEEQVRNIAKEPNGRIILCRHLGMHEQLFYLLTERTKNALRQLEVEVQS